MSSNDYKVMAVLTEHMGFPPITLIDEVINAVNEIMGKALLGLEKYLIRQRDRQLTVHDCYIEPPKEGEPVDEKEIEEKKKKAKALEEANVVFSLEDIGSCLALLETLCHSNLDKNFDKFELYTLRNILTIPKDLVHEGWIRLKHQDYLDSYGKLPLSSKEDDEKLQQLVTNINMELHIRKILRLQVSKATAIIRSLKQYKSSIEGLMLAHANKQLKPEVVKLLQENLDPINENVYYLLSQVSELVLQVLKLNDKILRGRNGTDPGEVQFKPSSRDMYIEDKTHILLEKIGLYQENRQARRSVTGISK